MSQEPAKSIEIFISYTHRDEKLKKGLENRLKAALKTQGYISIWQDREISPGKEWDQEINEHLNKAHIVLLLISSDFIVSDYCDSVEVKKALQRHEAGECRVIPVILRPVSWESAAFRKLQALPTDGKPVTDWKNRDKAFVNIIKGIQVAIQEVSISSKINKDSSMPPPQNTAIQNSFSSIMAYINELENSSKYPALTKESVSTAWESIKMRVRQKVHH